MEEDTAIQVLKRAMLLERQGKLFYEQVAEQTQSSAVRELFRMLAGEEDTHIEILSQRAGGELPVLPGLPDSLSAAVLSPEVRRQISAASYEAAAISAAMEFENRAVAMYSERAEASADPKERELYGWLAQWERGHQRFLAEINNDLLEDIWHDSGFWPF